MAERSVPTNVTSRWEWAAGGVSALFIAVLMVVLIVDAAGPRTPPDIRVRLDTVLAVDGAYLARLTVHNAGAETAEELVLEATAGGGSATETSTVTIQYLPGRSERRAGVFFRTDPRTAELHVRPRSYREP